MFPYLLMCLILYLFLYKYYNMTTYKISGTNIDEYFNIETSVVENNSAYNNFPSYEPTIEGNNNISQLYNIKNKFEEISLETMHGTKCDDTTVPAYDEFKSVKIWHKYTNKDFSELDTLFYNKLRIYLNKYMAKILNKVHTPSINTTDISDTGYQIQQYKKNTGYYTNHIDSHIYASNQGGYEERVITYIWYLNDINEGGETNFINQFRIKPVAGRLLIFPSTWSYPHAGLIPISSDKYIVTGWIYQNRK